MEYEEQIRNVKDYIRLPLVHDHWYVAGLVEEFGEQPAAKTLLGCSIVFYRTEAGDLVAMQNRCLHRSFPLSKGRREGDNLVCRYHGIRYAPDGSVAKVPCQDRVPDRKLHVYPVKEVGPFAFIWMGDPDQPDWDRFPDLPFLEDPACRTIHEAVHFEGSYLLMHENLLDLTHFAYLHRDSFGIGLGVDFSVHLVDRLRVLIVDRGRTIEEAIEELVPDTGRALVFNFACCSVGFGVLATSRVPTLVEFGVLTGVAVSGSFLASLIMIPALVAWLRPAFLTAAESECVVASGLAGKATQPAPGLLVNTLGVGGVESAD